MEVASNLHPSKILAQCSTQRQSTLKFRRTLSQITKKQPAQTTKCTFSGVVPIEAKRFLDSGTLVVECPECVATRSLELRKGVLRFPSHDKRKTSAPNAQQRWVIRETNWVVVGG